MKGSQAEMGSVAPARTFDLAPVASGSNGRPVRTAVRSNAGATRGGGRLWLRAGVSAGLIAYLAWQIDPGEMLSVVGGLRWPLWTLALAIYLGSQVLSARRWSVFARGAGFDRTQGRFLTLYFEGMFFSLCLPTSIGGDVVKAVRLGTTRGERFLAGSTILADRASGLAALLVIGGAALAVQWFDRLLVPLVAGVAILLLSAGVVYYAGPRLARRARLRLERMPRIGPFLRRVEAFRLDGAALAAALAYSLTIQLMNVGVVCCLLAALHLPVLPGACLVAVPAAALSAVLPVSVSGVGVREASLVFCLARYGVPPQAGATVGLLWFVIIVAAGLVGGLVYLSDRGPGPGGREAAAARGVSPYSTRELAEKGATG